MIKQYLFPILLLITFSSCISRLQRPEIRGTVTDFEGNPIPGAAIAETQSQNDGSFTLKEQRYSQFLITELLTMEAPPLAYGFTITKEGYQEKHFFEMSTHGGGARKGNTHTIDTIFMKRAAASPIDPKLFEKSWDVRSTQNADTLFFIHPNFQARCITQDCAIFHQQYSKAGIENSKNQRATTFSGIPQFTVTFQKENQLSIQMIQKDSKEAILYKGKWALKKDQLELESKTSPLHPSYTIKDFERNYFILIRNKE
ncbi:carboxypeptidase-like regulatory domain-containing protein [Flavobacterium kingsejongi]|uniref:Uncharacterized protein n=1 Tax=Flavobacterium kingsejongi TaxID=1678728 RepID=A0A2S1LN13_9FLAO|nr:carboxypeptidase-like regulatory domain-containing protein [Flavobacterium kingsejongi]AWG25135.1 hypothetical protein FK004_07760 [Flavobacterium kingsejongi]